MKSLSLFNSQKYILALKAFFKELSVPVNYGTDDPTSAQEILPKTYKENESFQIIKDVYFLGLVDDAAFDGNKSLEISQIKSDYDGLLIFGIELSSRSNGLLPTRSQLAEISRAFNREFYYTPVVIVFKYGEHIAFANTERLKYKQEWREGEKAGKVSLLRDIDIENPHSGHLRILSELKIPTTGKNPVDSFSSLYSYWQEVFSVSILNKKFYQEISNWYFWAIKNVTFPNKPTLEIAHQKNTKLEDLIQEHNATNVIRLLTRLLFTWFIKEKKLIPEELFDLKALQKDILNEIAPFHEKGIFKQANQDSVYYKAILQNLFFASLNCPIDADGMDNRKRGFRGEGYGTHRGIDYLMRYKNYFRDPDAFLEMVNRKVPFLNGGLFECLDDKYQNLYIDGFSDQMTKGEQLIVPDYLFFGVEEEVDLSKEYGVNNKGAKQAAVKGLINILKSYKFTITENTPIEEDVALDPELLGKVFENLLASYNPETKTTARKQTGSFYTPREIVNYMVDESLIAYLKNKILEEDSEVFVEFGKRQTILFGNEGRKDQTFLYEGKSTNEFKNQEEILDVLLHQLVSFDPGNPLSGYPKATKAIVQSLDKCKILDPACGSGAFPMGILQKMVHMLQKLDPENEFWKAVQIEKTEIELKDTLSIEDKKEREEKLKEINEAFDQGMNDPDYARKLYLIENCIYGVDIQPIASQISKLRFFISLVVDQKPNSNPIQNFGIRPLPNLETKFVTANTLIGIEKPKKDSQLGLYSTDKLKSLENELKKVRHKLFSARTKDTKLKYRQKDEELRHQIAEELKRSGWKNDSAEKLADWDPYDQNASSSFFDPEWMYDISEGFDVVIGNPPYRPVQKYEIEIKRSWSNQGYKTFANSGNIYFLFYEKGLNLSRENGSVMFITSNQWLRNISGEPLRKFFLSKYCPQILIDFRGTDIFENVAVLSNILMVSNRRLDQPLIACDVSVIEQNYQEGLHQIVSENSVLLKNLTENSWLIFDKQKHFFREKVIGQGSNIEDWGLEIYRGILTGFNNAFYLTESEKNELINKDSKNSEIIKPMLRGKDLARYYPKDIEYWLINTSNGKYQGRGLERIGRINVEKNYPTIYEHLKKYRPQLEKRQDKGDHWTNLRSCDYDEAFYKPKMIFMNMTKDLIFSYDPKGEFLTNQKCFIVTGNNLKYLTAFFNSKFFSYFFKDNFPELLGDVREVSKVYFEKIPVKKPNNEKILATIETLVDVFVYLKRKKLNIRSNLNQIIDGIITELYFPEHMKEREIKILDFVERDIAEALEGNEFNNLNDQYKEKVIEQIHATWNHPDNEVRNRIKLFAVRSPEILKPILES